MISVCVATYNGEQFIRRQIDSILSEIRTGDEIVISDDSSSDRTVDIIKTYNDPRIRILEKQHFHSPILNFENAIKQARGEIIFLSDQDDKWLDGRIRNAIDLHKAGCNLVLCNSINVYNDHRSIHHYETPIKSTWHSLKKSPFIGCMMSFDRNVLELALPFPRKIAMHDLWIGLLAQRNMKCGYIDEPLVEYNRHNESYIAKHHFSLYKKIKYRCEMYLLVRQREKERNL